MKKFVTAMVVILILGVVLCGVGCAVYFTSDNRFFSVDLEYMEKTFTAEQGFNKINLNLKYAHKLTFKSGEEFSVKYFDSNLTTISVSSENNTLRLSEKGFSWKSWLQNLRYKFRSTEIEITVPKDTVLDIGGGISGSITIELPDWEFGNINVKTNGSANIKGTDVTIGDLTLDTSGSANINLSGEFNKVHLHASGSMIIALSGKASTVTANTSGSMNFSGNLSCPSIDTSTSGNMTLSLTGTGQRLKAHTSGSSHIYAKDFTLEEAIFSASGSINAEVTVSTTLTVSASGSAKVYYYGDPYVTQSGSGNKKVIKRG